MFPVTMNNRNHETFTTMHQWMISFIRFTRTLKCCQFVVLLWSNGDYCFFTNHRWRSNETLGDSHVTSFAGSPVELSNCPFVRGPQVTIPSSHLVLSHSNGYMDITVDCINDDYLRISIWIYCGVTMLLVTVKCSWWIHSPVSKWRTYNTNKDALKVPE